MNRPQFKAATEAEQAFLLGVKVYDVKKPEKGDKKAEIGMLQKRLFCCRNCRLESGQAQHVVSRTLLESPEVLLQDCGIDSKKQGNVRRRPGQRCCAAARDGCSAWQQGRRVSSRRSRRCVIVGFARRRFYARRPVVCIPLTPRHRAAKMDWTAEHRDWEQQ
ncbi:hypothetical protein TNCV_1659601 [Trichonephila clavipes]|nr:hypothetical protein TNCV_1659601 [Trichonephila clavipes]